MKQRLLLSLVIGILLSTVTASASPCSILPTSVSVSASATIICSGTPVNFIAADSNGTLISYQWYKNKLAVGTGSYLYVDAALNNNDSVWVIMTCKNNCGDTVADTSNDVLIIVNPIPPVPLLSLVGGACQGADSLGVLVLGSSATQINWYWNGSLTGTQSLVDDTPVTAVSGNLAPSGQYINGAYLYVSDEDGQKVVKFPVDVIRGITAPTVAGGNGLGNAANQLDVPRGSFMDRSGNLYVVDMDNYRIQMYPPGSDSTTNATTVAGGNSFGTGANQLTYPSGIFIDSAGYLYVADNYNYRIQKFPPNSTSATDAVTVAGGNGNGSGLNQIYYAEGVSLDAQGNIYVADGGNNRILMFPPNSTSDTMGTVVAGGNGYGSAANQLSFPVGVALDAQNNIYVTDRDNNRIQMFPAGSTSATNGITVAGGNGQGAAGNQLYYPVGPVVFDTTGTYMFVVDLDNLRIQRYRLKVYYTPPGAGSYTVTLSSAAGCATSFSDTVTINASPVVTLSWEAMVADNLLHAGFNNDTGICRGSLPFYPLSGGNPPGGIYTGIYVTNDTLSDAFQNSGIDTITYTYTSLNGCQANATDILFLEICEGITNLISNNNIEIYPNPASDLMYIKTEGVHAQTITIYDVNGRIVASQKYMPEINIKPLSPGVYLMELTATEGVARKRFVKM